MHDMLSAETMDLPRSAGSELCDPPPHRRVLRPGNMR
jgi:hypothetical protein